MIIAGDDEVILGNKGENKKFSITTSAKAFKILSSGLYKNKIRAIVRELSCNCVDAHKLNGFEGAFDIQVPGQLDPRFVIRDYGPGLSKDGLENLYTTYFASTKNGSNDFIGALGLGSKSPFSYTDTFTVVSYHEGKAYGYTAMLDKGEPVIRPIFEEDMKEDERTGLEITVPVKNSDIDRWKQEIAYVVRPFGEAKVNLVGSSLKPDFFPEFEDVHFADNTNYGHPERSGLYAVYGSIVYPLNDVPGLPQTWMCSRHDVAYIKFPLGELDIAASREELSLDEQTIANIKSRVIHLDSRQLEADLKEWKECTNERKVVREVNSLNYNAKRIVEQRNIKFTPGQKTLAQLIRKYTVPNEFQTAGIVYEVYVDPKMKRIRSSGNSSVVGLNSMFGTSVDKLIVVIDNNKKGRLPAIRALNALRYSRDEEQKKILVENPWLPENGDRLLFVNPESEHEMNMLPDVLRQMGDDEVQMLYTSEIFNVVEHLIPKREAGGYEPRPKAASANRWFLKEGQWHSEDLFMTAKEAEELDGWVLFINGHNYEFFNAEHGKVYNFPIASVQRCIAGLGVTEFHVVRPTLHKKLRKLEQTDCLLTAIFDRFIELIDLVDYDYYSATGGRAYNYTRHTDKYPELAFLTAYFNESGKSTKESKELHVIKSFLNPVSVINYTDKKYHDELAQGLYICRKLNEYAEKRASDKIKKFEAENIIVSSYMQGRYELSEESRKEIIKLMGE